MNALARTKRAPSPCALNFPAPSKKQQLQDKIDLLTSEVDRLRGLLHFGAPVQELHARWVKEAAAFELSGNRVAARALRRRTDQLKKAIESA